MGLQPRAWTEPGQGGEGGVEDEQTPALGESSEPKVIIFDLPFGGAGVEASAYVGVSNFSAIWDNL